MGGVLLSVLGWAFALATDCPEVLRRGPSGNQDLEVRVQDQSFGISILAGIAGSQGQLVATWTDRQTGQLHVQRNPIPALGQGLAEYYLVGWSNGVAQIRLKAAVGYFGSGIVWAVGVQDHPEVDPFLLLDLSALDGSPAPYCLPGNFLPGAFGDLSHAMIDLTEQTGSVLASRDGILPLPRLQHQVTGRIFSSSDLTGGNFDGFWSLNHLSVSDNVYRLVETLQPSVLTMSFYQPILPGMDPQYLPQRIRLLAPGQPNPLFSGLARDYFFGGIPGYPAATSFAGSGGYVDYSGVSAPTGLTIEGDASTFYHYYLMRGLSNLDAKRLANPESVIGKKIRDTQSIQNVVVLGPFETQTVFLESGAPGVITRISLQDLAQTIDPTKVGARITFDEHASPDLDLTLEGLFLRTGSLTTSLPMPYDSEARFDLSNLSGDTVSFILDLERLPGQYPKPYGYLRGASDFGNIPEGVDFRGRTRVGQGKVVAERYETFEETKLIPSNGWLWEGDPRHSVDGQLGVSYSLTGTEDFSYWGWYFTSLDVPFSSPMSSYDGIRYLGNTTHRSETLFRGDHTAIHFYSRWTPSFEHGGSNDMPIPPVVIQAQHTALVYSRDAVGLMQDFVVGPQIFPIQRSVESRFEGDASHAVHSRSFGEVQTPITTTIEFSGSNIGLRLEFVLMRFDDPACAADIFFDDHLVGTVSQPWSPRSEMGLIKFFEETLDVPAALSAGLNHAQLRIEPKGCTWLQNDLRVLSYRQTK